MVPTAISKALTTLNQVESAFNLARTVDPQFFAEWADTLPALTEAERAMLDRIRGRYRYHRANGNLAEGVIKLYSWNRRARRLTWKMRFPKP
jgi:hypothetical protein